MGNLGDTENISMLERNKRDTEKERDISINFMNKENNNEMKKQSYNKTENRYEFSRLQDFDKDLFMNNNKYLSKSKTIQDNNSISSLSTIS